MALSGDLGSAPNEFLEVTHGVGISRVVIEGDSFGASFTLDDATYEPVSAVPEPASVSLFLGSLLALGCFRRRL